MNTKIIFNTDKKLKAAAQKKARRQGLTLSAVLNLATQAFVDDELEVDIFNVQMVQAIADAKAGRVAPQEKVFKRLAL